MSPITSEADPLLFKVAGRELDLSARTHIMGILNVTPDSFSDGGKNFSFEQALAHAYRMAEDGADIIDVGGESTRPDSDPVPVEEELRRVLPVIECLAKEVSVPLSIDTYKSTVAEKALKAGATIINDVSGFIFDARMPQVAAENNATVVLMHMQGNPKTMQRSPVYENVTQDVFKFLDAQVQRARSHGIGQIIIDPGIGFGKTLEHNLRLIKELKTFRSIGCPLLVGPSRKSFIGSILDLPVGERLEGTAAAVTACILNGANLVRVHDVKEMKRVARVADALK